MCSCLLPCNGRALFNILSLSTHEPIIEVSESYTVDNEKNLDITIYYKFGHVSKKAKEPIESTIKNSNSIRSTA